MSKLRLNFSEVKPFFTRLPKILLHKGEKGTYFAKKKMSQRTAKDVMNEDLRFFGGIECLENIARSYVHFTFKDKSVM